MPKLTHRRPSASMVVAIVALIVSLSATALAASKLVNGDKLITKGSLSGNRLRKHTLTGQQINLKRLGKVPSAVRADRASLANQANEATLAINADNATTAVHAANATSASSAGSLNGVIVTRFAEFINPNTVDHQLVKVGGLKVIGGCNPAGKVDLAAEVAETTYEISTVNNELTKNNGSSNPLTAPLAANAHTVLTDGVTGTPEMGTTDYVSANFELGRGPAHEYEIHWYVVPVVSTGTGAQSCTVTGYITSTP